MTDSPASGQSGTYSEAPRWVGTAAKILEWGIVGCWLVVGTLYARGRAILGHWPRTSGVDDPKHLDLGVHYELTGYAVVICALGTLLALALGVVLLRYRRATPALRLFLVAGASVLLFAFGPFVSWYLD